MGGGNFVPQLGPNPCRKRGEEKEEKRKGRREGLDRRGTVHLPSPLIHGQRDRVECRVEARTAPFLDDGEYWAGKRLMEGIDAALAVGQPMYWR